jgi:Fe-S cluster biosynthesis and repair protein YggX
MIPIVSEILSLPGKIGGIILDTMSQTVQKVAWTEYSRDLKKMLLQARHDLDENRIDKDTFRDVEKYVFKEMKIARSVLTSGK